MTNYQSAKKLLNECKTIEEVNKRGKGFDRVYKAGAMTANELKRINDLVIKRIEELTN